MGNSILAKDTKATFEILKAQVDRYEELRGDSESLAQFTQPTQPNADLAGMIKFNAQRAFNVVPPPGGRVESHITINDNDEKGTKFSSHISIKLYDRSGHQINDYKRYRTAPGGRQPRDVSRLTILSETNRPAGMREEDFRKLTAFMRIIDKCLNDYNNQREAAFKGGKLKRKKKVKKI